MIWLAKHWKTLAAAVLAVCLWGHGYHSARVAGLLAIQVQRTAAEKALADMARSEAEAQAKARKAEQAAADAVAEVAQRYEQDKADAQAAADRLAADLRAGNVRLRKHWEAERATDRLSDSAEAARRADEAEQRRAESAARIVRAADEADAVIRGLQGYARAVSQ